MNFIKNRFGSYRGYLNHARSMFALAIGRYGLLEEVDWGRVKRLVFVCKGNVCRSPYAEAKARLLGFEATSFGLETTGGVPANQAALRNAAERGIDLRGHRSAILSFDRLLTGDLVLAFEPVHVCKLRDAGIGQGTQISLVGLWDPKRRLPVIPDPFGKSDVYFVACFDNIDRSVDRIVLLAKKAPIQHGSA